MRKLFIATSIALLLSTNSIYAETNFYNEDDISTQTYSDNNNMNNEEDEFSYNSDNSPAETFREI